MISSVVYRGEEGTRRLELRGIHSRLRAVSPPVFRPRTGALTPGFAVRVLQLSRSLDPLRAVFRHTLSHEDSETAQRFRDLLAESRLPPAMEARRITFSYKEMKRQLTPGARVEPVLKTIGEEFNRYMGIFGGEVYLGFDAAMTDTLRLASLCAFDFDRLLKRFDPRFESTRTDYKLGFSEVPGEEALEQLLDLYFVIGRLQVTDAVAANVRSLASRLYRDASYDPDALTRAAERVRDMLQQAVPAPLVLDLIRAVRRDPAYLPRMDQGTEEHLAAFRRKVTEQYEHDRDRLAREAGRAALDADVKALFAGIELLALNGYSDEESAMLLRREMEGYDLVFPLRILKSFALACYENRLMDLVKRLLYEGTFRDRRFQESLSAAALAAESVRTRLEEFEGGFGNDGRFPLRLIHRSLDGHARGKASISAELRRIVRAVNREARKVLEEGSGAYYRLAIVLKDVLGDHKARVPEKVVNIRVIAGERNGDFIAGLIQGFEDIRRLLQIIRQFVVPQTAAVRSGEGPGQGPGDATAGEPAGAGGHTAPPGVRPRSDRPRDGGD